MKKLLVLLLALMVAGIAFAQDAAAPTVKWSTNVWTGFGIVSNSDSKANDFVPYNYDYEGAGEYRMKMTMTAADGNSGLVFRSFTDPSLGANPSPTAANVFRLKRAYGWAKFAGGMVEIQGGRLDVNPIEPSWGWQPYGDTQGVDAMYFGVNPIDGLSVGMVVKYGTNTGENGAWKQLADGQYGFKYTAKDLVAVSLGFVPGHASKTTSVYGGFNVLAVKDLTANMEFNVSNLGDSDNSVFAADENVAYAMGNLTVSAWMGQAAYKAGGNNVFEYNFEPAVAYKLSDSTTVGFIANVYSYPAAKVAFFVSPTDGISSLASYNGAAYDGTGLKIAFGAGPNVTFTSGAATLVIGDYVGLVPEYSSYAKATINVFYTGLDFAL